MPKYITFIQRYAHACSYHIRARAQTVHTYKWLIVESEKEWDNVPVKNQ